MMNKLSWLIYAADVLSGLSIVAGVLAFIGTATVITLVFYGSIGKSDYYVKVGDEDWLRFHSVQKNALTKWSKIPIIAALVAALLPSSNTVYAIAASEMGEEVVKSETAGKAMKALDAWLDRQIAPATTDD